MNKLTNLNFFLIWVFGFFVLMSFDLFVESFVFEWLEWNGTNKNDWFFILWWGLVVIWFLYGSISLYQRLKKQSCVMKKVLIKTLFSIFIFLQISNAHSHNDNNLDSLCTFSNIPLIKKIIGCRKVTIEEINSLKEYWSNETNEDLCHYFYFPIA